jgi:hypothetical protein
VFLSRACFGAERVLVRSVFWCGSSVILWLTPRIADQITVGWLQFLAQELSGVAGKKNKVQPGVNSGLTAGGSRINKGPAGPQL